MSTACLSCSRHTVAPCRVLQKCWTPSCHTQVRACLSTPHILLNGAPHVVKQAPFESRMLLSFVYYSGAYLACFQLSKGHLLPATQVPLVPCKPAVFVLENVYCFIV